METRLHKVETGEIDAVVLAAAGLERLGLTKKIVEFFGVPTAAGQGALMVEWRARDRATAALAAKISIAKVERCVRAERKFLERNGGGCYDTVGATARISAGRVVLKTFAPPKMGEVVLVGAGPGDPELITIKGRTTLQKAEIVFFDALIDEKLLKSCPPNCKKVFVGKRAGQALRFTKSIK